MKEKPTDPQTGDDNFARIANFNFTRKIFQRYPSLRAKQSKNGWACSKPYKGEPYDKVEFMLVDDGWNHEHCSFCSIKIDDKVPYWANEKEVIILCEDCFAHYKDRIEEKSVGRAVSRKPQD